MKILIVGGSAYWGLAAIFKKAFSSIGCETSIFDLRKEYKNLVLVNKITHRLFWKQLGKLVQGDLIKKVKENNLDFILVLKGWIIKPETLKKIRKEFPNIKIFNFNADNPFNTWHHGNSNSWIRKSIPLYDCYFIWGKFLIPRLKEAGAKRVEYLPFGHDPQLHYPVKVSNQEKKYYGSDVVFTGAWDKEREKRIKNLLNYDLKIWGRSSHWKKASREIKKKWQAETSFGKEFSKICNASKINLNFVRKQNGSAHNMRTFEIPACSGFMLSIRTPEQQKFFKEGKEAEYFDSPEELKKKIDYYLNHPEERVKIAEAGLKRASSYEYSYKARAEKILEVYNELNKNG